MTGAPLRISRSIRPGREITVRRSTIRSTAAILIVGAVAVAATGASAAPTPKAGKFTHIKVQLGYDLGFTVAKGKVTKVVAHVLERCDGASTSTVTTFAPDASYAVRGGAFGKKTVERFGGVTAHIDFRGRFTSPTRAQGTLKMETIVAGSTCTTYKLKWTAKRK